MDELAKSIDVRASLMMDESGVQLDLANVLDSAVVLRVFHVTTSDKDMEFLFVPEEDGRYSNNDSELRTIIGMKGVWYLELMGVDQDWRLRTRVTTPVSSLVIEP